MKELRNLKAALLRRKGGTFSVVFQTQKKIIMYNRKHTKLIHKFPHCYIAELSNCVIKVTLSHVQFACTAIG